MLYLALAVGVIGLFFGGFEIQQPAFKGFSVGGNTGAALPLPLRHHRLRRVQRLPRAGVQRHHQQADREGVALPPGRLRRDVDGRLRGGHRAGHGDDRQQRRRWWEKARAPSTASGWAASSRWCWGRSTSPSPSPSARWPSAPSCSTRSTCPPGWAATSSRSSSGGRARAGGLVATGVTVGVPMLFLLVAAAGQLEDLLDALRHQQPAARRALVDGRDGVAAPAGQDATGTRWRRPSSSRW